MAQSMSGLPVRGATAASTSVTRPLRTSATNWAGVGLGTLPVKPPTGRYSRPVSTIGTLDAADVSLVTTLTDGATLAAPRLRLADTAAERTSAACSCAVSAAGW